MSSKEIFVAILEDDAFSRNWMALLLVRDWRTRAIGEFATSNELFAFIDRPLEPFDILILDVDMFDEIMQIKSIGQKLQANYPCVKILLTGIKPEVNILQKIDGSNICGYILKNEVGYALSWVITFVHEGHWVITPGVQKIAHQANFVLPNHTLVLNGKRTVLDFSDHEAEVARMAFIFSVGRRDLADELKISEQWSYGLVSELYKKMGLSEILAGEADLFSYIGESAIIQKKFKDIIEQLGSSKKARDMETLAFHLLTMPEIVQ